MAYQVSTYSVLNLAKQAQAIDLTTRDGRGGTLVGQMAGANNSGYRLTAVGNYAGYSNIANENTAFGFQAGMENTTGDSNVFIGGDAGKQSTEGRKNLFVGTQAGYVNNNGNENIYIGNGAARTIYHGTGNIVIGTDAGNDGNTAIYTFGNHIAIGNYSKLTGNGTIDLGNGIANSGQYSMVIGHASCNFGENSIIIGNNLANFGMNSLIIQSKSNATPFKNVVDNYVNINDILTFSAAEFKITNGNAITLSNSTNVLQMDSSGINIKNGINAVIKLDSTGVNVAGTLIRMHSNVDMYKDLMVWGNVYLGGVAYTSNNVFVGRNLTVSNNAFIRGDLACTAFRSSEISAETLIVPSTLYASSSLNMVRLDAPTTCTNHAYFAASTYASNILASNLYISQKAILDAPLTCCNVLHGRSVVYCDNGLVVNGSTSLSNTLTVYGTLTTLCNLTVCSNLTVLATTTHKGVLNVDNDVFVSGNVGCSNSVVSKDGCFQNNLTVSNNTVVLGNITGCNVLSVYDAIIRHNSVMSNQCLVLGQTTLCNTTLCSNLVAQALITSQGSIVSSNDVWALRNVLCDQQVITKGFVASNDILVLGDATFCNMLQGQQLIMCGMSTFCNMLQGQQLIMCGMSTFCNVLNALSNTTLCNVIVRGTSVFNKMVTTSNDLIVLGDATFCNMLRTSNLWVTEKTTIQGVMELQNNTIMGGTTTCSNIIANTLLTEHSLIVNTGGVATFCNLLRSMNTCIMNTTFHNGLATFSNGSVHVAKSGFCNTTYINDVYVKQCWGSNITCCNLLTATTLEVPGTSSLSNVVAEAIILRTYMQSEWYYAEVGLNNPNSITLANTGTNYYVIPFSKINNEWGLGGAIVNTTTVPCFQSDITGLFQVNVYLSTNNLNTSGFIGIVIKTVPLSTVNVNLNDINYRFDIGTANTKVGSGSFSVYLQRDEYMYVVSIDETNGQGQVNNAFNTSTSYMTIALMSVRSLV